MRPQNSLWQGYSGYWQDLFIRENFLPLGDAAWRGFMSQGRGIVACQIAIAPRSIDWSNAAVEYTVEFIPLAEVSAYLQTLHLEATLTQRLIDTVQTYDPVQEILLLIHENGQVDICLLQNLKVSPPECHQQVQRRWSEFQLHPSIGGVL
ncbi:MAG: hypothetical protein F6K32_19780 [Desertifilum sp. SIO1I2]|nr:hypothetical protein [Desertifilum sp. SIO1I2]